MMFIFFLLYTPINLRRAAKKVAKEGLEFEWRVNNAGISVVKGEKTTKYNWESFSLAEESDGYYLLFSRAIAQNISSSPKRLHGAG